jgi:hypothetical protein
LLNSNREGEIEMKSGIFKSSLCIVFAVALAIGLTAGRADAADVYGSLSNFDLHVFVDSANDMELILYGEDNEGDPLECDDIEGIYPGWGSGNFTCEEEGGRIILRWSSPEMLYFCNWRHFGVRLGGEESYDIYVESASWTLDGEVVGTIPFFWQRWVGRATCAIGDIITMPDDPGPGPGPWFIVDWRWAVIDPAGRPELTDLLGDANFITGLDWNLATPAAGDTTLENPGDSVWFDTDPIEGEGSDVIVRYAVYQGGEEIARFYNAVSTVPHVPSLTEYGLIVLALLVLASGIWVVRKKKIGRARA